MISAGSERVKAVLNSLILPIIILAAWHLVTSFNICPPTVLPGIPDVIKTFVRQILSGQFFEDLGISLIRVVKGFLIAAVSGIFLGVIMAVSLRTNRFFKTVFEALRQIPTIAIIPLLIIWFGIGETTKVIMIAKSAFFPILLNTISSIRETPGGYLELARIYKLRPLQTYIRIYFPFSIPYLITGLRLALGAAWRTVVAAEIVAYSSGIGYRINDARMLMEPATVIVGILTIGAVGSLMDKVLVWLEKRITPWLNTK